MLTQAPPAVVLPAAPARVMAVRELPADFETPISVYLKLAGQRPSFLLESITGGEQVARYSFIGVDPQQAYVVRGRRLERHTLAGEQAGEVQNIPLPPGLTALDGLRAELNRCASVPLQETPVALPRFTGGLVGYLGFDLARELEPRVALAEHPDLPEAVFLQADTLVAFDHAFGRLVLVANAHLAPGVSLEEAQAAAEARLDDLACRLARSLPQAEAGEPVLPATTAPVLQANLTREQFTAAVRQAKEYIAAGDIFQVVLSQRLSRETHAAPFAIYRALRRLNPSPYMFYFDFDGLAGDLPLHLIGASPEMHVRLEGRRAAVRPIAGTRRRGRTLAEDAALAEELLADPKERAEHIMLLDLGRNDLGRVCAYGSVQVREQMVVERYSHVMHIVSHVEGDLRPERDAFDLMRATFPAGTVSGAPKVRAMQIIAELEGSARGPYAGAAGYFGYDGAMDTCITIRTLVMRGQTVSVQAGAGIVADSDPEREYEETLNKARALAQAVEMAEREAQPAELKSDRSIAGGSHASSNR